MTELTPQSRVMLLRGAWSAAGVRARVSLGSGDGWTGAVFESRGWRLEALVTAGGSLLVMSADRTLDLLPTGDPTSTTLDRLSSVLVDELRRVEDAARTPPVVERLQRGRR